MFAWSPFPFIRYAIALIIGILLSQSSSFQIETTHFLLIISIACIALIALRVFLGLTSAVRVLSGIATLFAFSLSGFFITQLKYERNQNGHYTTFEAVEAFRGTIISDNSERKDYQRYELEINTVKTKDGFSEAHGKIFLYVRKEGATRIYKYGDQLSVIARYFSVGPPGNPEEFDYKGYLEKLGIYSHSFASEVDISLLGNIPPNQILAYAFAVRSFCTEMIFEHIPKQREQAIMSALLIGIKDHLDQDTKIAYSSAGAMHVLAVSGLHVGIIYVLINTLFGFIKNGKTGKILFILLALSLIWSYALVTGFSPSVLRASVMFSVILVSQTISQNANIYNSLGIAAFSLLLYDPFLIYSVGFQLSFAAVFGIVFLQPKLVRLMTPSNNILGYLWAITCVSISAQLATFPLTVYYFHQFPTYFLVSNIIVIPAAVVILMGGIILILAGLIHGVLGQLIGWVLGWFIWVINELVAALLYLPLPIVDWLYFDFYDTILVYGIVLLVSLAFNYYSKNTLYLALVFTLVFAGWINYKFYRQSNQQRIIFYEIKNHIAIDLVNGKHATLLIDKMETAELEVIEFQVNPFRLANGLPELDGSFEQMKDSRLVQVLTYGYLVQWSDTRILVLTAEEKLDILDEIEADIVYLNSEKVECVERLKAKMVLVGSNIQYYALAKLEKTLNQAGQQVHSLVEDGHYQIVF